MRAEAAVLNDLSDLTGMGTHYSWTDWQVPLLIDNSSPLFGHTTEYGQGAVVGAVTVRAELLALAGYGIGSGLAALPGLFGAASTWGAGAGAGSVSTFLAGGMQALGLEGQHGRKLAWGGHARGRPGHSRSGGRRRQRRRRLRPTQKLVLHAGTECPR